MVGAIPRVERRSGNSRFHFAAFGRVTVPIATAVFPICLKIQAPRSGFSTRKFSPPNSRGVFFPGKQGFWGPFFFGSSNFPNRRRRWAYIHAQAKASTKTGFQKNFLMGNNRGLLAIDSAVPLRDWFPRNSFATQALGGGLGLLSGPFPAGNFQRLTKQLVGRLGGGRGKRNIVTENRLWGCDCCRDFSSPAAPPVWPLGAKSPRKMQKKLPNVTGLKGR